MKAEGALVSRAGPGLASGKLHLEPAADNKTRTNSTDQLHSLDDDHDDLPTLPLAKIPDSAAGQGERAAFGSKLARLF